MISESVFLKKAKEPAHKSGRLIDLEEYKKLLGSEAEKMTESEVLKLRDQQDQEAEIFFSMWLESINDSEK